MLGKCRCGGNHYEPLGIQQGWPGRDAKNRSKVLYMVNCMDCGTTRVCNGLEYALMKSREAATLMNRPFYSVEESLAA